MRRWRIESVSGVVLGIYPGKTEKDALDAMAIDAGYADYAAACDVTGQTMDYSARLIIRECGGDGLKNVAALYVMASGPYPGIPGVVCWTAREDATRYAGPASVVAHPPCGPWGRYAHKSHEKPHTGPMAVRQVRRWGGCLEHPSGSKLWDYCEIPRPGSLPDKWGGYTIELDQHRFGHPAQKRTWVYIVGCLDLPPMPPEKPAPASRPSGRGRMRGVLELLSKRRRSLTPIAFAEWLVEIARRCK